MGLKINIVVTSGRPTCPETELLESFGFKQIKLQQAVRLGDYINPAKGQLAIGYGSDFMVIAHDTLPLSIINPDFSDKRYFDEITLRRYFPQRQLLAALLHSVSNTYGMCLKRDREYFMMYGHSGAPPIERGEKTAILLEHLPDSYLDTAGKRIYRIQGAGLTQDEAGEKIVLQTISLFTALPSGDLYELPARLYTVVDDHLENIS